MTECAVVVNTKRKCRLVMDETGNLTVEEYFEKGQMDRSRIVREHGWVKLWENTISTSKLERT
jgi:hypothetical protein